MAHGTHHPSQLFLVEQIALEHGAVPGDETPSCVLGNLICGTGVIQDDLGKNAVRPAADPEIHVVLDLPRNDVGVRALGCDDQVDTEGTAQPGDGRQSVFNLA